MSQVSLLLYYFPDTDPTSKNRQGNDQGTSIPNRCLLYPQEDLPTNQVFEEVAKIRQTVSVERAID